MEDKLTLEKKIMFEKKEDSRTRETKRMLADNDREREWNIKKERNEDTA